MLGSACPQGQCLAKGHTLVTDDAKHFELLGPLGLVVENPLV